MGKASRTKGHSFEREVARTLRDAGLGDFWRVTEEPQQGNSGDVKDRSSRSPLIVQCQHAKRISVEKKFKEAKDAAGPGEIPVAWLRWHRGEEVVVIGAEDFLHLVKIAGLDKRDLVHP